MRFKSLCESLVHIERSFVLHRGVDQSGIQSGRGLIGLLAQISAHLPDLIAIEIDGIMIAVSMAAIIELLV